MRKVTWAENASQAGMSIGYNKNDNSHCKGSTHSSISRQKVESGKEKKRLTAPRPVRMVKRIGMYSK
jgi:hypothetical protein